MSCSLWGPAAQLEASGSAMALLSPLSPPLSGPSSPADYQTSPASSGPLPVGTKVPCRQRLDDIWRPAEIQNHRLQDGEYQYYVHYTEFDKRMDEWVTVDRMDLSKLKVKKSAKADGRPEPGEPTSKSKLQKGKKRKADGGAKGKSKCGPKDDVDPHDDHQKPKNVSLLHFGKYVMETWYFSPYHYSIERFPDALDADIDPAGDPPEPSDRTSVAYGYDEDPVQIELFVCEFCLKPLESREQLWERHAPKCRLRHPPGDEIYRDPVKRLSVFEVDGKKQRTYCQNICLLSKLFLEHKFLKYDVDPFIFYVMTEWDKQGHHFLGYFSKEKESAEQFNVACILTLPPYQKHGIGRLLIEFSYELSRKEERMGSPEKPLSDLGQISYHSYWRDTLLETLMEAEKKGEMLNVQDLCKRTCIKPEDVTATLSKIGVVNPNKRTSSFLLSDTIRQQHAERMQRGQTHIDPLKLHWTPVSYKGNT
eukprot:EG_transcript_8775